MRTQADGEPRDRSNCRPIYQSHLIVYGFLLVKFLHYLHYFFATQTSAGLAESNGRLLLGIWRDSLHVTCGLTACTPGSALDPTLGNEYGKTLPLPLQTPDACFPGLSRNFNAVLKNHSNNQTVTINKEPAQCCHHTVSNTTMHSLK